MRAAATATYRATSFFNSYSYYPLVCIGIMCNTSHRNIPSGESRIFPDTESPQRQKPRMNKSFHFYDEGALLERLSNGLKRHSQEVVFLVGAPLSAPLTTGGPGVPGVGGVIDLIRREFEGDPLQLQMLNRTLESPGMTPYQAAFEFLQGRRGPQVANAII